MNMMYEYTITDMHNTYRGTVKLTEKEADHFNRVHGQLRVDRINNSVRKLSVINPNEPEPHKNMCRTAFR